MRRVDGGCGWVVVVGFFGRGLYCVRVVVFGGLVGGYLVLVGVVGGIVKVDCVYVF